MLYLSSGISTIYLGRAPFHKGLRLIVRLQVVAQYMANDNRVLRKLATTIASLCEMTLGLDSSFLTIKFYTFRYIDLSS